MAKAKKDKSRKKKVKKFVESGVIHIRSTFNNTNVTITDEQGNTLTWASSGSVSPGVQAKKFEGSRKGTPFAAQLAAQDAAKRAQDMGLRVVRIEVKGPGAGREAALRALQGTGLKVTMIKDVTPIPHNGCRPPKRRRV